MKIPQTRRIASPLAIVKFQFDHPLILTYRLGPELIFRQNANLKAFLQEITMLRGQPKDRKRRNGSSDDTLEPSPQLIEAISELLAQHLNAETWQRQLAQNQNEILNRMELQQSQIEALTRLVEQVKERQAASGQGRSNDDPSESPDPNDWQAQKARFMEGFDESSGQMEPMATDPAVESDTVSDDPDAGRSSESSMYEPAEVAELRSKLEEKLRRAEIEISVERAKIARIRQELDEQRTEMERQFARRKEELQAPDGSGKKSRWKKFLAFSSPEGESESDAE